MITRAHLRLLRFAAGAAALALVCPAQVLARGEAAREWHFDVSLDGRHIGEHRFVLREDADARELTSEARFRVRIWFIDAYHYEHSAREWWQGDCLDRLDARTDANGERSVVIGRREPGEFRIQSGDGGVLPSECVQTFAYWNPRILDSRRLLNPQTGEYVEIEVRPKGREVIGGLPADRYQLLGRGRTPLEIDVWYTPARDWVALESRTPEGRLLRYARK